MARTFTLVQSRKERDGRMVYNVTSETTSYEVYAPRGGLPWEVATLAKIAKGGRAWRWAKDLTKGVIADVLAFVEAHRAEVNKAKPDNFKRVYATQLQANAALDAHGARSAMALIRHEGYAMGSDWREIAIARQARARAAFNVHANVRGLFDTPEVFEGAEHAAAVDAARADLPSMRQQAYTRAFGLRDDAKYFNQAYKARDMADPRYESVILRQLLERAVIRRAVADLLQAGFTLRINDGEEWACDRTRNAATIMDAIMSTDDDRLIVLRPYADAAGGFKRVGMLWFVYGNTGYDVICDYHTALDPWLGGVNAYAEALAEAAMRAR